MKIYVLDPIANEAIELLHKRAEVVTWKDPAVDEWLRDADGIIISSRRVNAAELAAANRLKAIAKTGTGVDNIDLDAARARGVVVTNTPGANAQAVAEHTVGLALAVARRIALSGRLVRAGNTEWNHDFRGSEIGSKRIGVVGVGNTGRRAGAIFAEGFGCEVWGLDPYLTDETWTSFTFGPRRVESLDEIIGEVDLLTLHVPLTEETRSMIGGGELVGMREGAILINTSRGAVVDEAALDDALAAGRLGGAGLDVFEREPPGADHPLLAHPTVVFTPHIAGISEEGLRKMGETVAAELLAVLEGREPRFRVA
jgi:D-3-phosphoglycerate dehydrogenase